MSDFLARLALRATDTTAAIRPRPLGRFEPAADPRAATGFDAADLHVPDNQTAISAPPPSLPVDAPPPLATRRHAPSVPRPASDAADSAIGERATTPSPSRRGLGRGAATRLAPLAAHPATEAANSVTAQATTPSPSGRGLGRGAATRPACEPTDSATKAQGRRGAREQGRNPLPSGKELVNRYAPRTASELVTRRSSLVTAEPATRHSPPATPSASEAADSAARPLPSATRHSSLVTRHSPLDLPAHLLAHLRAALHPGPDERPLPTAQPPAPAPVVHVHIGRVELRAAPPPPRPSAPARPAPALATVDDYLRRRNGERS